MQNSSIPTRAQVFIDRQLLLEQEMDKMEAIINKAAKGPMGLTLDSEKTNEWRAAKATFDSLWEDYRRVNVNLSKMRKLTGFECIDGKRKPIYEYKG